MAPNPPPFGQEPILGIFPPYFVYTLMIVLMMAAIFYWLIRHQKMKESPMELLKRRYAGGEIDRETFREMKKDLAENQAAE